MNAIAYIRFSTDDQSKGTSIQRQQENIEAYASRKGLEIAETLIDDGFSASKGEHLSHGKLGRFLVEADQGKYKGFAFIVERLDRLSRLGIDQTHGLLSRLLAAKVIVHVTEEGRAIESMDDLMTVIQNVLRSFADQEFSKKLSERISKAYNAKKAAALASRTPYGKSIPYWLAIEGQVKAGNKIVDHGKIVEIPERVAVVREVFALAAQGIGSRNIAQSLNEKVLTRSWIAKTINNRAVLGEFQPGKTGAVIPDYFPQIIDQSLFNAVRAQLNAKRRNHACVGGNRRKNLLAENLFTGLLLDITSEPFRNLHFQTVRKTHYVMSTPDKSGRTSNRIRYDMLEKAILGFLSKADWQAISAESESDEYKEAKAALETILRQIDSVSREIAANTEAMKGEDVDTKRLFMRQVAKDEAVLYTLTDTKDALQGTVEAAQAKSADLAEAIPFLELLNQLNDNPSLRLKFRTEIQRRIARIELVFMPDRLGVAAIIHYTNGVLATTMIFGREVDTADLRARGLGRIERSIIKPEFYEELKAELRAWVQKFAQG
jgi:DNA invertase Pin-like site-specific DNA recombinase